ALLYSESTSRFLVEVTPANARHFEAALAGLPCAALGTLEAGARLAVTGTNGKTLFEVPLEELARAFHSSFQG
ncbi:MAG: hypothetical protein ABL998_21560, partial [Planctomycetota bacterium]